MSKVTFAFDERLDVDFLEDLFEGDKEHATMVFEQFLTGIHPQLKEVDDNFLPGNIEMFRQKVHRLKPVFSFVGLTSLTTKAQVIEDKCKQNCEFRDIESYYNDFKSTTYEFIPIIENELSKLKN